MASGAGRLYRGVRSVCMGVSRNPYKTHTAILETHTVNHNKIRQVTADKTADLLKHNGFKCHDTTGYSMINQTEKNW